MRSLSSNFLLLVGLFMLTLNQAQAWWCTGHMVVARIAYEYIQLKDPIVLTTANTLLSYLSSFTTLEKDHPFVESATFADAIKSSGFDWQSQWHFVDNPFFDDGYTTTVYPELNNNTWELTELVSALKGAKPHSTSSNSASTEGYVSYDLGNSFNLRLLIHYIGDVHQPLHAVSRYTSKYPNGDRGGNSFQLTKVGQVSELHALWDSAVYLYEEDMELPLSDTNWNYLGQQAKTITTLYPESSFTNLDADIKTWNQESLKIDEDFVYQNIQENTKPSDEYVAGGQKLVQQQLAKAGYRLARTLLSMWSKTDWKSESVAASLFLQ